MKYFDLTHTFAPPMPVYPGDMEPEFLTIASIKREGYADTQVTTGLHVGTHIDAPAHMIAGGALLSAYPVDRFMGRGVLIDARDKRYLDEHLFSDVELRAGDIVLVLTGWSKWYRPPDVILDRKVAAATAPDRGSRLGSSNWIPDPVLRPVGNDKIKDYFTDFPVAEESFAERLVAAGISMVGFDTPSPDPVTSDSDPSSPRGYEGASEDLFPVHHLLLGADILIAENVNHLDQLANVKAFDVIALPTKFALSGAPARIVARV
jgi:kynurenine formamidase